MVEVLSLGAFLKLIHCRASIFAWDPGLFGRSPKAVTSFFLQNFPRVGCKRVGVFSVPPAFFVELEYRDYIISTVNSQKL